ncbi:hypothetical protein BHM03_00013993 [Ensete ventricosum]|nr:hypothetical protein BHM03_00013993 [Ensete ventricosum]
MNTSPACRPRPCAIVASGSPTRRRHPWSLFLPREETKRLPARGEGDVIPFLLPLLRLIPSDSGQRRSKSIVIGQFQAIMGRKQPQSVVQSSSGQSSYRFVPPGLGGTHRYSEDAQLTPLLRLGAGACAGIIAMSATYPMDMVRGRITVQIPYVGLNFAVYESLKDWLIKSNPYGLVEDSELSVVTRLACGAAAGTVGQTVAYPLDVIRRRMQMVGWNNAASVVAGEGRSKASLEYTGMIDAFRKTVHHEGFGALYKGLVPNSVKVVPSIAIAFVTYEVVKDILGVEMRLSD